MWRRRRCANSPSPLPASDSPASTISPSEGVSSPATRFSSVDLPQPDGPITATNSPDESSTPTPRSARTLPASDSNVLRSRTVRSTGCTVIESPTTQQLWTGSGDAATTPPGQPTRKVTPRRHARCRGCRSGRPSLASFQLSNRLRRRNVMKPRGKLGVAALAAFALALFVGVPQASATYPGHNGRIVFAAQTGDTYQLYTVRPNGDDLRQITHTAFDSVNPDWSPDGGRIVFEMGTADCSAVALVNADGGDLVPLPTAPNSCEGQASFTPDGQRIVFEQFVYDPCCADAIWSMNLSGGDRHRLTDGTGFGATDPNVSPDGTRLSYVGFNGLDFGQGLFTTGFDGANTLQLAPYSADVAIKQDWAPDGRHLVFTDNADFPNPGDSANVATVGSDGSDLRYLTHYQGGELNAFTGGYSPNGQWIVFRLEDHGLYGLYRMRPDGGAMHAILPLSSFKPRFIDWGQRAASEGGSQ